MTAPFLPKQVTPTLDSLIPRMSAKRVELFWKKVDKTESCWIWNAARDPLGYGRFAIDGKRVGAAHRVSYLLAKPGVDITGLVVDHLCRNSCCVNPAHLEAVTQRVNVLRGVGPSARQAQQDACRNGHAFTDANTYVSPEGKRVCIACRWIARGIIKPYGRRVFRARRPIDA